MSGGEALEQHKKVKSNVRLAGAKFGAIVDPSDCTVHNLQVKAKLHTLSPMQSSLRYGRGLQKRNQI